MIPIDYDLQKLALYDQYIDNFIKRIDSYIKQGYVGDKRVSKKFSEARSIYDGLDAEGKRNFDRVAQDGWGTQTGGKVTITLYPLETDSTALLKYIQQEIKRWKSLKPSRFQEIIDGVKEKGNGNFNENSPDHYKRLVKHLFIDLGYDGKGKNAFPKGSLVDAVDADVCPYCNRVFIKNVHGKDGKEVKGQLDHFYDKDKYPYLALLKYNLVPCCPFCNGPMGKHNKDAVEENMISPYDLSSTDAMHFSIEIENNDFLHLDKCAESIRVKETYNESRMENNSRIFHLEELYNTHRDYAAEMYYKSLMTKSKAYKDFAEGVLKRLKVNITENDWARLMLGFPPSDNDYNKRPISKFCRDIYEELMKSN